MLFLAQAVIDCLKAMAVRKYSLSDWMWHEVRAALPSVNGPLATYLDSASAFHFRNLVGSIRRSLAHEERWGVVTVAGAGDQPVLAGENAQQLTKAIVGLGDEPAAWGITFLGAQPDRFEVKVEPFPFAVQLNARTRRFAEGFLSHLVGVSPPDDQPLQTGLLINPQMSHDVMRLVALLAWPLP